MKGLIDTNLLIYASAESVPQHASARAFLDTVARDTALYATTWINLGEYISFTTQSFGGAPPLLSIVEALTNVSAFLTLPSIQLISEGERYWPCLQEIFQVAGAVRGAFVHDCRIAAIMRENGVETIFTHDTAFRRIPHLTVVDPLN